MCNSRLEWWPATSSDGRAQAGPTPHPLRYPAQFNLPSQPEHFPSHSWRGLGLEGWWKDCFVFWKHVSGTFENRCKLLLPV